jgi:glycosyltransferase involved in cell wall biosynthesis
MIPITVAIPTYNRSQYLKKAIKSVISQTFEDFELIVIDNASSDNTSEMVHSFSDPRIKYFRNKYNIGMIKNWNRAIKLARGQYLLILGDDDKLKPNFLEKSVAIHKRYPFLGFTFCHCNKVDEKGNVICLWGYKFFKGGYIKGPQYLKFTIENGCCMTNSSTALVRKKVYDKVGVYKEVYGQNTFDFNMWLRIANAYDVFFINEVLVDYRVHSNQVSEIHWRTPSKPTGKLGTYLECFDTIARLLQTKEASKKRFRKFLSDRLLEIDLQTSQLLKKFIKNL